MPKEPLGITLTIADWTDPQGVYEDDGGIDVFSADGPYLLSDGASLMAPLSVFDAGGPTFQDRMGKMQSSLAVKGMVPPIEGVMWDDSTPWDNGTYWS